MARSPKLRIDGIARQKLNTNAPASYLKLAGEQVRNMMIANIITKEPFMSLMPIKEAVLKAIIEGMRLFGFDASQPLIVWKEKNVLLDGHTRLIAARAVELKQVPVIYVPFDNEQDALNYMYDLQFNRRNIDDSDLIVIAPKGLEMYRKQYGSGNKAEFLAKKFIACLSEGKAKKLIAVLDNATAEQIESIKTGEQTINTIYNTTRESRAPEAKQDEKQNGSGEPFSPEDSEEQKNQTGAVSTSETDNAVEKSVREVSKKQKEGELVNPEGGTTEKTKVQNGSGEPNCQATESVASKAAESPFVNTKASFDSIRMSMANAYSDIVNTLKTNCDNDIIRLDVRELEESFNTLAMDIAMLCGMGISDIDSFNVLDVKVPRLNN